MKKISYFLLFLFVFACDSDNEDENLPLELSFQVTNVSQFGGNDGAIDLTVTGEEPFIFQWSNGASTEDISDLSAGIYTVSVTDALESIKIDSVEITQPSETQVIDSGPKFRDEEYDFYVAMSISEVLANNVYRYYVLVTASGSDETIESVDIVIQDQQVPLIYQDYGDDFYIAYVNLEYEDVFEFKLTINDVIYETQLEMLKELTGIFPSSLDENEDITVSWTTENNPQHIYLEGFQYGNDYEELEKNVDYFLPNARTFNMPADWLWSNNETTTRAIQLGIMNYKIVNRTCFTISDDAYAEY